MIAKYIFAVLAVLFVAFAAVRLMRDRGQWHPRSRTWLLVGGTFGAVSACLFYLG